jgi:hypothetical protein
LIIDPDTVLTFAVATELFEAIPWRISKVLQASSLLKSVESDFRPSSWYSREPPYMQAISKLLAVTITESGL